MNVLVTGAAGLVGSSVCKWLLRKNMTVTGAINNATLNLEYKNFQFLKLDLTNENIPLDTGFTCVVHCSAVIPKPNQTINDETLFDLNQKIDQAVFSYCLKKKVKLVYISTAYMYVDPPPAVLTERSAIKPDLTGYYRSKRQSEEFILSSEIESTIFRLSSPYGDLGRQNNVMRLFAEKIKNGLSVTFVGEGARKQNFLHTDDIAEACWLAINRRDVGVYNLTHDTNYSMLDLASYIKEIYGSGSEFVFDHSKTEQEVNLNFNNDKLKKDMGWSPKYDLKSGLTKTLMH